MKGTYEPTMPPDDEGDDPYDYNLRFDPTPGTWPNPHKGLFVLELSIWRNYYCYHATQCQPKEEGWYDCEAMRVRSPFLTECLTSLDEYIPYAISDLELIPVSWSAGEG